MLFQDFYNNIPSDDRIVYACALKEYFDSLGVPANNDILDYVRYDADPYITPDNFFFMTSFVSAQMKAPAIEDFIARRIGGYKISSSDDRGDVLISENNEFFQSGEYIELKTSTNNKGEMLNVRQIRLWQDVDWYLLSYIDETHIQDSVMYLLTHEDMIGVCYDEPQYDHDGIVVYNEERLKYANVMHGTHDAVRNNVNVELALSFNPYGQSETTQYLEQYRNDSLRNLILGID